MKIKQWFISVVIFFAPFAIQAGSWTLVPEESQLSFTATQNGAPVSGEFKKFTGDFAIDLNDLPKSSMDVVVDISSLSVSYAELKTTLASAPWFDESKFPKAEYKSTKFTKVNDTIYQVDGLLTLRDKTLPLVLNFTADLKDPKKGVFVGTALIKRTAFGVGQGEWSSVDAVKDDVAVHFKVVAVEKD
ncbi:MAG: YceI family protein [Legionella sp.]|jgi:polyisoprenoid-binding protein YceI